MRVVFGAGSLRQLREEAELLGLRRLLVLSTPDQRALAEQAAARLGDACAGMFTEARMHVPVQVAEAARAAARDAGADGCLAIGGSVPRTPAAPLHGPGLGHRGVRLPAARLRGHRATALGMCAVQRGVVRSRDLRRPGRERGSTRRSAGRRL
ncbi:iron-containing alcohol dehydrogenase [Streptomyces sp. NPDC007851]|uniref:iron-containing alcohol dehydrogenase n=1 Tax=Streptomyces sp. NPDC007851 TaxID=3155008 RepID=UPI0033E31747